MSLLFMDGCDKWASASQLTRQYASANISSVNTSGGRFGGGALYNNGLSNYAKIAIPSTNTVIVQFAFKYVAAGYRGLFGLMEGSTVHFTLGVDTTNGQPQVLRGAIGGTLLASPAAGYLNTGAWVYIEAKVAIHDSAGSVILRVNGAEVVNLSGVDTRNGGTGICDTVSLFATSTNTGVTGYIDDIIVMDTNGSANNDFLGDRRIYTLYPNGAGSSTDFTPSAGSNYQCVDEPNMNDDTDYVASSTIGHIDMYAVGDLPSVPAGIDAVQVCAAVSKTDAGAIGAKARLKSGSTTVQSSAIALATSYTLGTKILETDPDTSAAWSASAVNAIEIGAEVTS